NRMFLKRYAMDNALLSPVGAFAEDIYAITLQGDLAVGSSRIFDRRTGRTVYHLPFTTTVMAASGDQSKLFLYNSGAQQLATIPLTQVAPIPGPGLNPTPANGAVVSLPLDQLSWTASPLALRYEVYFSTNSTEVANAVSGSQADLGSVTNASIALAGPLELGRTYYWRVDAAGVSTMTTGAVWGFQVAPMTI